NAADIYRQQVALGHWIAAYLPADARIAINDAGAMKYYGNRYTVDLVGLTSNDLAGLRHLGDAPIFDQLLARPLAQRPDYFIVYDSWFPELVRLPGFLTEIHRTHLLHNTVTSGDDVPVYQAHWEAIHTADQPLLDHRADDTEQPAAKVVVTGGLGSDPVYLAHLVLPAAHGVTLRAEAAGAARLDYLELVEDGSSQATRLVAAGLPLSATATLPAGSYRLYAAGQLPAGAPLTVRLLTPDLRLGLPAKGPAPRRQLVDQLDLGNLAAEQAHAYTIGTGHWDVYPTTLLKSATYAAAPATPYVDTGRSVPGWQQMTVATTPGRALKLVLRYLSPGAQRVQVAVDGQDAGLWFYPGTAGWGEAEFVVPAPLITQAHTRLQLTLVPDAAGHPLDGFYLWFYQ
ncbi:MAG TPA: hypothetical protein VKY74_06035, partial [Chloroflexia bacterium]|nr:hypothetical protein [Chloroflexia bacterium]